MTCQPASLEAQLWGIAISILIVGLACVAAFVISGRILRKEEKAGAWAMSPRRMSYCNQRRPSAAGWGSSVCRRELGHDGPHSGVITDRGAGSKSATPLGL